jgi:aspartate racemase
MVGIIGGLGPETTAEFYLELIFACKEENKKNYPPILINSIPLSFAVERDAIAKGIGEKKCLPYLINAAKELEEAGADFLVLPCNSLHIFITEIRNSVDIPVLSILEEASRFLKAKKVNKVGIIATAITMRHGLYEKSLRHNGIRQVVPNDFQQAKIGQLIHNIVSNRHDNKDREVLMKIIKDFSKNRVKHVLLACTDLQLLMPQAGNVKIYDTMKILADATVKNILNSSK